MVQENNPDALAKIQGVMFEVRDAAAMLWSLFDSTDNSDLAQQARKLKVATDFSSQSPMVSIVDYPVSFFRGSKNCLDALAEEAGHREECDIPIKFWLVMYEVSRGLLEAQTMWTMYRLDSGAGQIHLVPQGLYSGLCLSCGQGFPTDTPLDELLCTECSSVMAHSLTQ